MSIKLSASEQSRSVVVCVPLWFARCKRKKSIKTPEADLFSFCFIAPQAACVQVFYKGGATALRVSTKLRPHPSLRRQTADPTSRETLEGHDDSGSPRLLSLTVPSSIRSIFQLSDIEDLMPSEASKPQYWEARGLEWRTTTLSGEAQVDVLSIFEIEPKQTSGNEAGTGHEEWKFKDQNLSIPLRYVLEVLHKSRENGTRGGAFVKLLIPRKTGYAVQSDFVQRRLVGCSNVSDVTSFIFAGQEVRAVSWKLFATPGFQRMASHAIAGVLVVPLPDQPALTCSKLIDMELEKRLSLPWLSRTPIIKKRIAFIGGPKMSAFEGYITAAKSLDIGLMVVDEPTHWLADEKMSHLWEHFVPCDMTADDILGGRFASVLDYYLDYHGWPHGVDGVMTIEEHLVNHVSVTAKCLDLPTSPSASVGMVQNKFQTRQLDNTVFCAHVNSASELEDLLQREGNSLEYPLIVKPNKGRASEGVWRVSNKADLRDAVGCLWKDSCTASHSREVVIGTYVHGPEIDANVVLLDGEILFFEINDDFPSPGDQDDARKYANFVGDPNMKPSGLPRREIDAVGRSLHQYLMKANFRSGVFHIKARLRNSRCRYSQSNGALDLVEKPPDMVDQPDPEFSVFLLKIDPRPPGMQKINATERAHGVSYYSLSLLSAIADKDRLRALSRPFAGWAQYHM